MDSKRFRCKKKPWTFFSVSPLKFKRIFCITGNSKFPKIPLSYNVCITTFFLVTLPRLCSSKDRFWLACHRKSAEALVCPTIERFLFVCCKRMISEGVSFDQNFVCTYFSFNISLLKTGYTDKAYVLYGAELLFLNQRIKVLLK